MSECDRKWGKKVKEMSENEVRNWEKEEVEEDRDTVKNESEENEWKWRKVK